MGKYIFRVYNYCSFKFYRYCYSLNFQPKEKETEAEVDKRGSAKLVWFGFSAERTRVRDQIQFRWEKKGRRCDRENGFGFQYWVTEPRRAHMQSRSNIAFYKVPLINQYFWYPWFYWGLIVLLFFKILW